jgi:hypothetical protein
MYLPMGNYGSNNFALANLDRQHEQTSIWRLGSFPKSLRVLPNLLKGYA